METTTSKELGIGEKIEAATGMSPCSYEGKYSPTFWRKSQADTFEEAVANGATYVGEPVEGFSAWSDAMRNVTAAAKCIDAEGGKDMHVRLIIDNRFVVGDFAVERSC